MKKFKYRLESILQFKENQEKEAKINLGIAVSNLENVKRKIEKNNKQIENLKYGNTLDDLKYYQTFLSDTKKNNEFLKQEVSILEDRKNRAVEKYNSALREQKKFSMLKEKKLNEYMTDYKKSEIKKVDDLISCNFKNLKER